MLKYTDTQVTFREIPEEITLCINISGCPIKCKDCHSKELWEDIGEELTIEKLRSLIQENKGITCVCFMGGDSDCKSLLELVQSVTDVKTAFYSGRDKLTEILNYKELLKWLNYFKLGSYKKELGGLDNPNTNQRLYMVHKDTPNEDITYKFWNNDSNLS